MVDITKESELLGVNTKTLRRWDNEGKLKAYRALGGHRRYRLNEEMVNDLISIVTCFSAGLYGSRGGRKVKKDIEKTTKELGKERGENSENNNEGDSNK